MHRDLSDVRDVDDAVLVVIAGIPIVPRKRVSPVAVVGDGEVGDLVGVADWGRGDDFALRPRVATFQSRVSRRRIAVRKPRLQLGCQRILQLLEQCFIHSLRARIRVKLRQCFVKGFLCRRLPSVSVWQLAAARGRLLAPTRA